MASLFQDLLKRLGKTRQVQQLARVPEVIPRATYTPRDTGNVVSDFLVNLLPQTATSLINVPSNIATGSRDIARTGYRQVTGQPFRPQEYLSGVGQLGEGIVDIASIAPTTSIVKSIGKQSVKELLKRGAKTGFKYGTAYGAATGLQEGEELSVPEQIRLAGQHGITSGIVGAGLGTGLAGTGVLVGKGIKTYRELPAAQKEAGYVKVPDVKTFLKRSKTTLKDLGELSVEKPDFKLEGDFTPSIKKGALYLNRITKSFDPDKGVPVLDYVQRRIGEVKLNKYIDDYLGTNITNDPKNVTSFWEAVKADLKTVDPAWKVADRQWREAVYAAKPPVTIPKAVTELPIPEIPAVAVKPVVSTGATNIEKSVLGAVDLIKKNTPKRVAIKDSSEAGLRFRKTVAVGDMLTDQIFDEAQKRGIDETRFVDMIEGTIDRTGADDLVRSYRYLEDAFKELSEKEFGYLPEHFPRQPIDDSQRVLKEIFPNTMIDDINERFGFAETRTGKLTEYIKERTSTKDFMRQAMIEKYRPFIESERRGIDVKVVQAEEDLGTKLVREAEEGRLEKVDTLGEFKKIADVEAQTSGNLPPEKILVKGNISILEYGLRDAWVNFKKTGIWNEAFEPLANAYERSTYQYNTIFKPLIEAKDFGRMISELGKIGISEDQLSGISTHILSKPGKAAIFIQDILRRYHTQNGTEILTNWLKTHDIENGKLKDLVNYHAAKILTTQAKSKSLISKTINFINRRVASGFLGLNIRSGINNLLEGKRAMAISPRNAAAAYAYVSRNAGVMRTKYGIREWGVEDFLAEQRGLTGNKLIDTLSKVDDTVMTTFKLTENLKDDVFLYIGEKKGMQKGLQGDDLFRYTMDFYQKYAHKYGQFGTVGFFNNDWVKLVFQFSQYATKEAGLLLDMAGKAFKGDKEAIKYLAILAPTNMIIWGILSKAYGAGLSEIWGSTPFVNARGSIGGPAVTAVLDLWDAHTQELATSEKTGEPYNVGDVLSARKVVRGTVPIGLPAGVQLLNKTGSAIADIERGYNLSAAGRVRFLAPEATDIANMARALVMGPYATEQARQYFNEDLGALGEKQTGTFNQLYPQDQAAARAYYQGIQQKREAGREEKKSINQMLRTGQVIPTSENFAENAPLPREGPLTIDDIINKRNYERDVNNEIDNILYGDDYAGLDLDQKKGALTAKGISDEQVRDYFTGQLKSASPEDRADFIIGLGLEVDFTKLYKLDVLTPAVAKDLERKGFIDDADALMEKMQMTDVYYQRKAMRKLQVKTVKGLLKAQATTKKRLLNAQVKAGQSVRSLIRRQNVRTATLKQKLTKARIIKRPRLKTLAVPKPYKIDLPKRKFML